jgi:anhydro-N-acetylmuramic acid kinase
MKPAPDALRGIRDYRDRDRHLLVGLMTGTSADGVDAALVRVDGSGLGATPTLLAYRETPLEEPLRREILDLSAAAEIAPERMLELDAALGERYAAATLELLAGERVSPTDVDAIGCHGQTLRHVPRGPGRSQARSWQIGSAAVLAERTGIPVVSGFRQRDTAAGGEGAPLVPLADWWLFRSLDESRVLLNLGGIANLTFLPRDVAPADVLAFDTGPANALLDGLVRQQSGGALSRDEGGALAARGAASEALLVELLADPFFAQPPPRSTGRERFGDRYAHKLRELGHAIGLSDHDVLATAVELIAASVRQAAERFLEPRAPVDALYVSGGGARNAAVMGALDRRFAPVPVHPLEALGVASESKEALAFALLAHLTLAGLPGNLPSATGALGAVVLGHITPGVAR